MDPNPTNPPQSERPKKGGSGPIAAVALFVLFALGVIMFLYNQNQQLKEVLSQYQQMLVTPTPMAVESPPPEATSSASTTPSTQTKSPTPVACTQEAQLCPDGSYVGRVGPDCEFAPCPTP